MSKVDWKIGDANKSQLYILPMLGFKLTSFFHTGNMPQCQFRNCFIGDQSKQLNGKILLVYEFSPSYQYTNFVDTLKKHDLFEYLYELDNKHTVFVFTIPPDKLSDYHKILLGEYSKISEDYKNHIIKFHDVDAESSIFGILYRTGTRKEQLESIINEGLPKYYWTKIPPFTELEEPFDEIEVLQCVNEKTI